MATTSHRIAVIGGDGIGPDVVAEAIKVARAAGVTLETNEYDLGGARYLRTGEVLTDATVTELRDYDAILLGAVGTPRSRTTTASRTCLPGCSSADCS